MATAIRKLRDGWPREEFPDATILLYADTLERLPEEHVEAAIDKLMTNSRFRPSIGEVMLRAAESALALPTPEEAWAIAERGDLKAAPEPVWEAAEYVGGRYAIVTSTSPATIRSQFRRAYESLRERAVEEYAHKGFVPALVDVRERRTLGTTMASLPETERVKPRPVMSRLMHRWGGHSPGPPTEAERSDAIEVLREGPWSEEPHDDPLYREAETIFGDAAAWDNPT